MQGRRTKISVSLNGRNITSDLDGDTLSLTFNDSSEENADNVDFQIQNRDKKWLKGWFPDKMDSFTASIQTEVGTLDCGTFLLDDVGISGRPLTVSIKGVAKPSDQDFSEVEHNQTWEEATLRDIASTIAGRAGVALEYDADSNPTIKFPAASQNIPQIRGWCHLRALPSGKHGSPSESVRLPGQPLP